MHAIVMPVNIWMRFLECIIIKWNSSGDCRTGLNLQKLLSNIIREQAQFLTKPSRLFLAMILIMELTLKPEKKPGKERAIYIEGSYGTEKEEFLQTPFHPLINKLLLRYSGSQVRLTFSFLHPASSPGVGMCVR